MLDRPVVGWVGGGETVADRDQLAAFDTPGISVGSPVEDLGDRGLIEPDDHPNSIELVRSITTP